MPESADTPLRICLLTDVFPPRSGGSGWSTYYLGKALSEAGHSVLVMRPVYDKGVTRAAIRRTEYGGLRIEEVLIPDAPVWVKQVGLSKAWSQRKAGGLLEMRARTLSASGTVDVLHGQHSVSGIAASRAARKARWGGAIVASVCTVRDYWPLCPVSTRLFGAGEGMPIECEDCHRLASYLRCTAGRGSPFLTLPLAIAKWLNTLLGSRDLARANAVIAVSDYVSSQLANSGRVKETRLYVIPNLVDLPSADMAVADEWPLHDISSKDSFMLFVGKLDVNKGAWMLPRMVAQAGVRMPVVVAGDGPLRSVIEAEAVSRGLDFRFYDWLDNDAVLRLMRGAQMLLFPSAWQEPLSRVLLEGCAAGAAIVALDTGGTRDVITDGVSGWLAADEGGFVEGIREVATRPDLNARLRMGARGQAECKFAAPVVSAQVVELYRRLLDEAGGGSI